jgi:hypothetical protein
VWRKLQQQKGGAMAKGVRCLMFDGTDMMWLTDVDSSKPIGGRVSGPTAADAAHTRKPLALPGDGYLHLNFSSAAHAFEDRGLNFLRPNSATIPFTASLAAEKSFAMIFIGSSAFPPTVFPM